jgi:putative addiction module component (TIGR02574 family)
MAKNTEDILREALSLPPEARAALADSLLESLDTDIDEGAEQEWREEIRRRIADLDSGRVQPIAWSEVRARLNRQIGR